MTSSIEIFAGDVNDVEAHVFARYTGAHRSETRSCDSDPIVLRGTLRGPYCTNARTLPAEFKFHDLGPQQTGLARAIIPDPCMWLPETPQLYQVDVEACRGEQIVAKYHGQLGLKRTTPRRGGMAFPG